MQWRRWFLLELQSAASTCIICIIHLTFYSLQIYRTVNFARNSYHKENAPDVVGGNLLPGEYNGRNLIKENDFLLQKYWRSFSECEGISLVCVVCLHYNECDGPVSSLLSTWPSWSSPGRRLEGSEGLPAQLSWQCPGGWSIGLHLTQVLTPVIFILVISSGLLCKVYTVFSANPSSSI